MILMALVCTALAMPLARACSSLRRACSRTTWAAHLSKDSAAGQSCQALNRRLQPSLRNGGCCPTVRSTSQIFWGSLRRNCGRLAPRPDRPPANKEAVGTTRRPLLFEGGTIRRSSCLFIGAFICSPARARHILAPLSSAGSFCGATRRTFV